MDPSSLLTRMRIRAMGIVIISLYSRRWDGERGGGIGEKKKGSGLSTLQGLLRITEFGTVQTMYEMT